MSYTHFIDEIHASTRYERKLSIGHKVALVLLGLGFMGVALGLLGEVILYTL